jgi:hypothetical protein
MAAHASDWGDSSNQRRRGEQTAHHVDDVCGGGCVGDRQNYRTIPTVENLRLRGGSFSFPP